MQIQYHLAITQLRSRSQSYLLYQKWTANNPDTNEKLESSEFIPGIEGVRLSESGWKNLDETLKRSR